MTYSRPHLPYLMLTDIRSLRYKVDELSAVIESNEIEVCCVTETWLHGGVPTESINLAGFSCHRIETALMTKLEAESSVIYKTTLKCERLRSLVLDDLKTLWLRCLVTCSIFYLAWSTIRREQTQSTNDYFTLSNASTKSLNCWRRGPRRFQSTA